MGQGMEKLCCQWKRRPDPAVLGTGVMPPSLMDATEIHATNGNLWLQPDSALVYVHAPAPEQGQA